jgi:hypothetical protein
LNKQISPAGAARDAHRAERKHWIAYQKFPQIPDLWIAERKGVSKGIECSSLAQAEDVIDLACWKAAVEVANRFDDKRGEMMQAARACGARDRREDNRRAPPEAYSSAEKKAWWMGYSSEGALVSKARKEAQKEIVAERARQKKKRKQELAMVVKHTAAKPLEPM